MPYKIVTKERAVVIRDGVYVAEFMDAQEAEEWVRWKESLETDVTAKILWEFVNRAENRIRCASSGSAAKYDGVTFLGVDGMSSNAQVNVLNFGMDDWGGHCDKSDASAVLVMVNGVPHTLYGVSAETTWDGHPAISVKLARVPESCREDVK